MVLLGGGLFLMSEVPLYCRVWGFLLLFGDGSGVLGLGSWVSGLGFRAVCFGSGTLGLGLEAGGLWLRAKGFNRSTPSGQSLRGGCSSFFGNGKRGSFPGTVTGPPLVTSGQANIE